MGKAGFFESLGLTVVKSQRSASHIPRCGSCGLKLHCRSPVMKPYGKGLRKVLVVGEAPGLEEDRQGRQFVGPSGQLLRENLPSDINLDEDCWTTNSLVCHPPRNKLPEKSIAYCRPILLNTIQELQPEVIILLGGAPVKSLLTWLWKEDPGGITRWAGWRIPCQSINTWIVPTWHPSHVLRDREKFRGKEPVAEKYLRHHLKKAFELEGRPWKEVPDFRKRVTVIFDASDAARRLRDMTARSPLLAFDYETNGLNPDSSKRELVSCSVSDGEEALSFPVAGEAIKALQEMLTNPRVGKLFWNMNMETRWARAKLGVEVANCKFDGMLATHTLDNRSGICGLKFQSFVQLGQESYDDHIKDYLRPKEQGAHAPNRIQELIRMDFRALLLYGGLDALLTYKVCLKQAKQLGVNLAP